MDNTIEKIWENGFDTEKIIPPNVIDLYNKKSILTVDKLKSTSKKDLWSIIPIAIITFIVFIMNSKFIFGLYVSSLMLVMFFIGKKKTAFLNTINTNDSCFKYLSKLQKMIKDNDKFYTRLLGIYFPFCAYLGFCILISDSELKQEITANFSTNKIVITSIISLITFSIIGVGVYKLTTYVVYGRLINKIDKMIKELKYLNK